VFASELMTRERIKIFRDDQPLYHQFRFSFVILAPSVASAMISCAYFRLLAGLQRDYAATFVLQKVVFS